MADGRDEVSFSASSRLRSVTSRTVARAPQRWDATTTSRRSPTWMRASKISASIRSAPPSKRGRKTFRDAHLARSVHSKKPSFVSLTSNAYRLSELERRSSATPHSRSNSHGSALRKTRSANGDGLRERRSAAGRGRGTGVRRARAQPARVSRATVPPRHAGGASAEKNAAITGTGNIAVRVAAARPPF